MRRLVVTALGWFYWVVLLFKLIKDTLCLGYSTMWGKKTRSKPAVLSDPSLGTHGFLQLEDVRIHYVASGPEDKPLMLFLHGFPDFWYSWRNQIREFQKDFRVVAIDQRGYGESDKPAGIGAYMGKNLMNDVQQVILALGYKSCVLVGHDWGAVVAWAFGRFFPDMVDKLIIMNVPAQPSFEKLLRNHRGQQKNSWYMAFFQTPYLPELALQANDFKMFDKMFSSRTQQKTEENAKVNEDDIEAYKYTFSQPGAITPPINWYRAAFQKRSVRYDMDFVIPILVIWGVHDPYLHIDLVAQMEKDLPKLEIRRIQEAGHFVHTDCPDKVNKSMREWLESFDE